jgi:hypothetical protein
LSGSFLSLLVACSFAHADPEACEDAAHEFQSALAALRMRLPAIKTASPRAMAMRTVPASFNPFNRNRMILRPPFRLTRASAIDDGGTRRCPRPRHSPGHILATNADARIAVLYQNDVFGKDYLVGLREGVGADRAGMIIKEVSYEVSEPTIDSQVITLQDSRLYSSARRASD